MATETDKESASPKLPILLGAQNYRKWAIALELRLMREDVWLVVSGRSQYPESERLTRAATTTDPEADQRVLDRQEAWLYKDNHARGTICSHVSEDIVEDVIELTTSKAIWNKLKEKFHTSTDTQSFEGIQELMTTHLDNCKNVQEYVNKVSVAIRKIKLNLLPAETFPETLAVQYLLVNLGPEWKTFVTVYINGQYKRGTHKFGDVANALLQEEMRMTDYDASVNLTKARKRKDSEKGQEVCQHCKKTGHQKAKCWTLYPEQLPEKFKREGAAGAVGSMKEENPDKTDLSRVVL